MKNIKENRKIKMCLICDCEYDYTKLQGIKNLDCSYCRKLTEIPIIEGLQELNCYRCPLLTGIPIIEGLKLLNCAFCPLLKKIPMISTLEKLFCYHCPLLTVIPAISTLKIIYCYDCPRLAEISNIFDTFPIIIHCTACPWLKSRHIQYSGYTLDTNPEYYDNISKLVKVQKFCRKKLKYFRFKRWIKSLSFVEWFYAPENFGGYKAKLRMEIALNSINI